MGVSVGPGARTLTVIRRGTSSIAQLRDIPISAALVAAYWLLPAAPVAVRLPISTILPPSSIRSTNSSTNEEAASTWTLSMSLRSSSCNRPSG